jgi:hypothetical protein
MSAQPPGRRSFQQAFPRPRLPRDGEAAPRQYFYKLLMQVAFRNDYYPPPAASPDFTVQPTPATGELMQRLGLLFRAGAAGFAILYDEKRKESLLSALGREAHSDGENWAHLSFVMRLDDPWFVNFTDIPLDTEPAQKSFYFSNRAAHRKGEAILLNRGSHVSGSELLLRVPGQLPVPIGPEVEEVRVLAISKQTVLCRPRCVPVEQTLRMPPDAIPCGGSGPKVCRSTVYLDFSLLPEGRYTIQEIGYGGTVLRSWNVLSTATVPVPFGFIDLLLTRPKPGEPGIYPVRGLWRKKPAVASVDYQLVFRRRSTVWRYYVVLPREAEDAGLQIRSVSPPRERFSGPDPVRLGDGTPAALFTARKPLPLQARPDVHLLLRSDTGILLDPLPVASSRQVLPAQAGANPTSTEAFSDIYVYV